MLLLLEKKCPPGPYTLHENYAPATVCPWSSWMIFASSNSFRVAPSSILLTQWLKINLLRNQHSDFFADCDERDFLDDKVSMPHFLQSIRTYAPTVVQPVDQTSISYDRSSGRTHIGLSKSYWSKKVAPGDVVFYICKYCSCRHWSHNNHNHGSFHWIIL
jgi:hypothetical protein